MYSIKHPSNHISTLAALLCTLFLLLESFQVRVKLEYTSDDKQLAQQEIDKLHRRLNSQDYDSIYNSEAIGLKQAISKKDFFTFLISVHREFGDFKDIIDKRITVIGGSPVQFRAVCNSQFEKGILTEMIIFLKVGDQIQLAQYRIAKGPAVLPQVGSN